MVSYLLGFIISSAIVVLAYYKHTLSTQGAIMAFIIGTLIYGLMGFYAFFILLSFFLIAFLIRFFHDSGVPEERNAAQVFAIGGLATFFAVLYGFFEAELFKVLFITAIAGAAADGFSSEIGKFSKNPPFSILSFKEMKRGLSGAISPLGLLFGFIAALFYSILALFTIEATGAVFLILFFAFFNTLLDSVLGLAQVKYKYPSDTELFDQKKTGMVIAKGIAWLTNDRVNLISNIVSLSLLTIAYLFLM